MMYIYFIFKMTRKNRVGCMCMLECLMSVVLVCFAAVKLLGEFKIANKFVFQECAKSDAARFSSHLYFSVTYLQCGRVD